MKRTRLLVALCSGVGAIAAAGAAAFVFASSSSGKSVNEDPRLKPPFVEVAAAKSVGDIERSFTGSIAARVQSNLGFRVPGKIIERLVEVGQEVKADQPLMRIDETDLHLALLAKEQAVAAARAVLVQTTGDEKRYAALVKGGIAATPQRYEQAKAAMDTAKAQLDAAEAEAKVARNEASYSVLKADADGTIVKTMGEPGQVVAAGQTVVELAHAGPREAVVDLPETIRPAIGSKAYARVYGNGAERYPAHLRRISDAADPVTRTYEARYVLGGHAARAPLGATVTIEIPSSQATSDVEVPIGAIRDDGSRVGVWVVDGATSTVHFGRVRVRRLDDENAVVSGIKIGQSVVALGVQLLHENSKIRTSVEQAAR